MLGQKSIMGEIGTDGNSVCVLVSWKTFRIEVRSDRRDAMLCVAVASLRFE